MKTSAKRFCQLLWLTCTLTSLALSPAHASETIAASQQGAGVTAWTLIDNFESPERFSLWQKHDTRNDTNPHIPNPQVTEVRHEANQNHYLIKKPAAEGVVGNRKALSFYPLPKAVNVGETYTFFTRINVESFPNNHVFGLSSQTPEKIIELDYNALEPSLRVTDKKESDGTKNDGTLMVKTQNGYARITNPKTGNNAQPLQENTWYDIWYVVNNSPLTEGGQQYDVYIRGGEFLQQTKVYSRASFRMRREQPLIYFLTNCNTGPADKPYGNGGLKYDDLYMAEGTQLSSPTP